MSLNKAMLIGRLGKDPEIRAMESGRKVANFTMATDNSYKDRDGNKVERTDWHNVVFWGPQAEVIERYVKKGTLLYVEGRISTRSYEQDGITKYITEIVGNQFTMLGGRSDSQGTGGGSYNESQGSASSSNSAPAPVQDVDDLPF